MKDEQQSRRPPGVGPGDKPQARGAQDWERAAGTDRPGVASPSPSIRAGEARAAPTRADTMAGSPTAPAAAAGPPDPVQAQAEGSLNPDRKPAFAANEHPLGAAAGAAAGTLAGAVMGLGAGPVGSIIGAAAGAVAGGVMGAHGATDTANEEGPLEAPEARDTASAEDLATRRAVVRRDSDPGQGTTGREGGLVAPGGLPFDEPHWRDRFGRTSLGAVTGTAHFEHHLPAYRLGHEAWDGRPWSEREAELRARWDAERGDSPLSWDEASPSVREAWEAREGRERT
jgi:hypothetical protein